MRCCLQSCATCGQVTPILGSAGGVRVVELDQAVDTRTAADLEEETGDNSGNREPQVGGGEETSAGEVEAALDEILRERIESSLDEVEEEEARVEGPESGISAARSEIFVARQSVSSELHLWQRRFSGMSHWPRPGRRCCCCRRLGVGRVSTEGLVNYLDQPPGDLVRGASPVDGGQ